PPAVGADRRQPVEHVVDEAGPTVGDGHPGEARHRGEAAVERDLEAGEGARLRTGAGLAVPAVAGHAAAEHKAIVAGQAEVVEDARRLDDPLASGPAERV